MIYDFNINTLSHNAGFLQWYQSSKTEIQEGSGGFLIYTKEVLEDKDKISVFCSCSA